MTYPAGSLQDRLLGGDREALDLVGRWIAESLTAARFWRLRSEWKDLRQEVLVRLFQSLRRERFRLDGQFKSYVQAICRHTAQDRLAERARKPDGAFPADQPGEGTIANIEGRILSEHLVRRLLDESSAECREMILAYFVEGASYAELASRFEVPVGTAKSRLFRCLQCLRKFMAQAVPKSGSREKVSE